MQTAECFISAVVISIGVFQNETMGVPLCWLPRRGHNGREHLPKARRNKVERGREEKPARPSRKKNLTVFLRSQAVSLGFQASL